jgi:lipoate-protein ligase A
MPESWRILDTGLSAPVKNIALSRALLEARRSDEIASTLRFARSTTCVLLGSQESAEQVVDLAACTVKAVPIQRRISGGPAMYVDDGQLLWELVLHRSEVPRADMRTIVQRVCHAVAAALSALQLDARFRAPDDIEVDGRVVARAAAVGDGQAVLVQGAVFLDLRAERFRAGWRFATDICGTAAIAPGTRSTSLREVIGRTADVRQVKHNLAEAFESAFEIEFREADLTLSEMRRYETAFREIDHPDWIALVRASAADMPILEAMHPCAGGVLRAVLAIDAAARRIKHACFDVPGRMKPARSLPDLEASLRDVALSAVARRLQWFFASRPAGRDCVRPDDFAAVVERATGQLAFASPSR